jgi:hypothetical protein
MANNISTLATNKYTSGYNRGVTAGRYPVITEPVYGSTSDAAASSTVTVANASIRTYVALFAQGTPTLSDSSGAVIDIDNTSIGEWSNIYWYYKLVHIDSTPASKSYTVSVSNNRGAILCVPLITNNTLSDIKYEVLSALCAGSGGANATVTIQHAGIRTFAITFGQGATLADESGWITICKTVYIGEWSNAYYHFSAYYKDYLNAGTSITDAHSSQRGSITVINMYS